MTSFHNSDPEFDRAIALSLDEQILTTALKESNELEDSKQMERLHRNECRHWYQNSKWPTEALQLKETDEVILHAGEEDGNCVIYGICNILGLQFSNEETVASIRSELADEIKRCVEDSDNIIFNLIIDRIPEKKKPLLPSELSICKKLIEDTRKIGFFLEAPHYQAISNINHRRVIVHFINMTPGTTNFNVIQQQFDPSVLNDDLTPMLFVVYATQHLAAHAEAVTAKTMTHDSISISQERPININIVHAEAITAKTTTEIVNYKTRQCNVCQSKPFTRLLDLEAHMRTKKHEKNIAVFNGESTTTEYRCAICKLVFSKKRHLDEHAKQHADQLHKCTVCNQPFLKASNLKQHYKTEKHMKLVNEQKSSSKSIDTADDIHLAANAESVTAKTTTHDSMSISQERPINTNIVHAEAITAKTTTEIVNYKTRQCNVCQSKPFTRLLDLEAHMRTKKHEKNIAVFNGESTTTEYRCAICKLVFSKKRHLDEHAKQHADQLHKCTVCNQPFSNASNLKQHYKTEKHMKLVNEQESSSKSIDTADDMTKTSIDKEKRNLEDTSDDGVGKKSKQKLNSSDDLLIEDHSNCSIGSDVTEEGPISKKVKVTDENAQLESFLVNESHKVRKHIPEEAEEARIDEDIEHHLDSPPRFDNYHASIEQMTYSRLNSATTLPSEANKGINENMQKINKRLWYEFMDERVCAVCDERNLAKNMITLRLTNDDGTIIHSEILTRMLARLKPPKTTLSPTSALKKTSPVPNSLPVDILNYYKLHQPSCGSLQQVQSSLDTILLSPSRFTIDPENPHQIFICYPCINSLRKLYYCQQTIYISIFLTFFIFIFRKR